MSASAEPAVVSRPPPSPNLARLKLRTCLLAQKFNTQFKDVHEQQQQHRLPSEQHRLLLDDVGREVSRLISQLDHQLTIQEEMEELSQNEGTGGEVHPAVHCDALRGQLQALQEKIQQTALAWEQKQPMEVKEPVVCPISDMNLMVSSSNPPSPQTTAHSLSTKPDLAYTPESSPGKPFADSVIPCPSILHDSSASLVVTARYSAQERGRNRRRSWIQTADEGNLQELLADLDSPPPGTALNHDTSVLQPCRAFTPTNSFSSPSAFNGQGGAQLEWEGYLWKRGSSTKLWVQRYFVLQNLKLFYFYTEEEAHFPDAQPLGVIPLTAVRYIGEETKFTAGSEGSLTSLLNNIGQQTLSSQRQRFCFRLETFEKVWIFGAESQSILIKWLTVLQSVLRVNRSLTVQPPRSNQYFPDSLMEGWMQKHFKGFVKFRYFVLREDGSLCYFKNPKDPRAQSVIKLGPEFCTIEVAAKDDDSESGDHHASQHRGESNRKSVAFADGESDSVSSSRMRYSQRKYRLSGKQEVNRFALHTPEDTFWLRCKHLTEFEKWVHLLLQFCPVHAQTETCAEKTIKYVTKTIIQDNQDYEMQKCESHQFFSDALSNCPAFSSGVESWPESMTQLSSNRLRNVAQDMFEEILLFTETIIHEKAVDYHLTMAQSLIDRCLINPELQNEILLQLTKVTLFHPLPDSDACRQAWILLAICTGIFLPTREIYPFMRIYLEYVLKQPLEDPKASFARAFAQNCLWTLSRVNKETQANSMVFVRNRQFPPSSRELLHLMTIDQTEHQSMTVEIHCKTGEKLTVPVCSSTIVAQVIDHALRTLGLDESTWISPAQYALYYVDPFPRENNFAPAKHYLLSPSDFIADTFSRHELALRILKSQRPEFISQQQKEPIFTLKLQCIFPPATKYDSDAEPLSLTSMKPIAQSPHSKPRSNSQSSRKSSISVTEMDSASSLFASNVQPTYASAISSSHLPQMPHADSTTKFRPHFTSSLPALEAEFLHPFNLEFVNLKIMRKDSIRRLSTDTTRTQDLIAYQRWQHVREHASFPEKVYLFRQMHDMVVADQYPLSLPAAISLTALQCQFLWGDHFPLIEQQAEHYLQFAIENFLPVSYWTDGIPLHPFRKNTKPNNNSWLTHFTSDSNASKLRSGNKIISTNNPALEPPSQETHELLISQLSKTWSMLRGFTRDRCLDIYLSHIFLWMWGPWAHLTEARLLCHECRSNSSVMHDCCPSHYFSIGYDGIGMLTREKVPLRFIPYKRLICYGQTDNDTITCLVDVVAQDDGPSKGQSVGTEKLVFKIITGVPSNLIQLMTIYIDSQFAQQ